jgi:hypothetical protein
LFLCKNEKRAKINQEIFAFMQISLSFMPIMAAVENSYNPSDILHMSEIISKRLIRSTQKV